MREELSDFVAAIDEVPELDAMLRNPQIDQRAKASMLDDMLGGADVLVQNFLLLVVEKDRGGRAREIRKEFERCSRRRAARLDVELTTAHELSDEEARASSARSSRHPAGRSRRRARSTPT